MVVFPFVIPETEYGNDNSKRRDTGTDPNYLILGDKAPEFECGFMDEMLELMSKITDPKMQEILLKQIRALV